jgi:hypothetical protein
MSIDTTETIGHFKAGYTRHFRDGELHCDTGPAVIYRNGDMCWYRYGKIHRDCLPAIISANGDLSYHQDGQFHRIGGPAVILHTGEEFWYVHGQRIEPIMETMESNIETTEPN